MVKSKMNRFTAMLLSMIMIFSSFSILTTTQVSAASDPERVHVDMYETGIKWAKTVTFYEPLSGKNWTYWQGQERHVLRVRETKQVAYCLQPGTYLYDWGISANPVLSNKLNHAWDNLGKEKRNAIKLAMYFGYPNTNTTLSGTANEKELATQLIIWEFISGYRDADSYNRTDARFIKALCGNNYDQNKGIYKAYGQIESAMKSFKTIPSFSNKKIESAPTHTLKWDGTKYTITLTDTNGVLSKYSLSYSNSDIKISKSGNKLTITSTNPINSAVSVKATKSVSTGSNSTIAYGHESEDIQDVIVKTDSPDPVYGYFKVKTEATGSLKVVKQYKDLNGNNVKTGIESFVLNNTKFKIRNSSDKYIKASYSGSGYVYSYTGYVSSASDGTVFTPKNNNGDFYFEVNKLPPGTYEIMEQDNNITGYTPSGSKNIKVAVTANNSGGKKTATFQNKPDQLIINKVFNQFGAVKDEDYAKVVFNLSQINAEGVPATKSFICTDEENNVYQFINTTSDAAFAGIVTSKELRFVNPKVHSITVTGMPITNNDGYYYKYEVKEVKNGHTNRYDYSTMTKTFETGTTQSETFPNNEKKIGYLEIKKDFKIEQTDGSLVNFEGNSNLTLTQAYGDISFTVKDSAGKYITAVYQGANYSYTGVTTNASNATKFVFNGGNTSGIKINDMPFGTYSVTEVTGSRVKGQGFRVQETATKKTTTSYNISADTVTGGSVKFVNVKPQYVGLRIYKIFTDSEGENINVSKKIYDQVEFVVKDYDGNNVLFTQQNKNSGTYTVYKTSDTSQPFTAMKLGADTKTITLTGLEAEKAYTVTERIVGSDLKKICVCKSLFTVEGTKENAVIYAPDDSVVQSGTVTMPTGESSIAEVHFENTYKTTEIEIYKESDDDLVERKFAVTTVNYDLYPESDPLYVMSEVRTSADGKIRGIATAKDLPLAYYDHDTDSIVKIQYKIEEVDTPEYYEIPAAQTIIPMDGQKSVTIKNKLKTGTIKVIKKAEVNGSTEIILLPGIEFRLRNSYNKTVLTAVTDANGEILFENLPIAVGVKNTDGSESIKKIRYTVSEVEGENNEKYVLADDHNLVLDYTKQANQRIKTLQVLNTPITGNVFLEKADARTLELLSGAEFTIYNDVNGNGKYDKDKDTLATGYTIEGEVYTPHHTLVEVMETMTDDDGNTTTKGTGRYELYSIEKGKYIVVETKTPVGYVDEHKEFPFEITDDQQTIQIYESVETEVAVDGEFKAIVSSDTQDYIADTSDDFIEITDPDEKYVFNTPIYGDVYLRKIDAENAMRLSGAIFRVWADSDNDGKLDRQTDESVGIMKEIKDSNDIGTGEYEMNDLPYGNYFVVETIAPEGYKKSNKTYSFSITENGARVFVDDIKNPPIKGNVSVLKIDSLTKEQLKDAEFTVYNDIDKDGLITDGIDTVYAVMNHDEGYRYYLNDLPYGEYVLKETKAPVGHIMTKKIYPFQIIDDGVTVEVADDGEIGIMNEPIQGSIRIVKIDRKNQTPVEGAEFTLYDSNGKAVKVVITDKDGIADFGQHRYGKYTVVETTAPEKYLADNTPIPFEILEHGKIYGYTHENTPIEGNIEIVKVDNGTQKPLSGAEFTLYDSNGNEVQKLTTGEDGKVFFTEVSYGKYTVVETKAPKDYKKDSTPIPFEILEHGKTLKVTKDNEGEEGTATFIKTSEDGVVKNVTLHIYGKSNTGIEVDETVVTGENGSVSLSLLTGTYTVEEIKVADRYVKPAKQTIKIEADKTSTVTFNNILKRGKVTTTKVDKEYPDNKLTGAVFEVYDADGNSVDTLKEVSKGVYELDGLTTGNYTLKEIFAPVGFLLDNKAYDFLIVNDGDVITIETKAGIGFINTPIKGTISVVKVDENTRKPLSGAEFTIYDTTGKPVKTTTTDTGTVITDANGIADFGELRYGTYIVKETKAPENYKLDDAPIPFQVLENGKVIEYEKGDPAEEGELQIIKKSEDGVIDNIKFRIYGTSANGTDIDETVLTNKDGKFLIENLLIGTYTVEEMEIADRYIKTAPQIVVVSANETASVTFENILKRGKVTTTKIDKDYPDNKLTGATFEVYDSDGNAVDTLKEVSEGVYELDVLTVENYTLRETKAPDGFELDENAYPFEITENGDVRNIETLAGVGFINNPQKGDLVINKRSSDKKLEGFSFRITGKAVTGQEYDQIFKTDAEGKITVKDLRVGTYTVSEISDETNVRYNLPDDQTVEIKSKEVTEVEMYNDEKVIPFEITKSDISTGELIPGCGFRIRNSDGEIVIEGYTDENGIAKFELVCGDYTYQEFDAPQGYIIDEKEYPFTINPDDTVVKAEMKNTGTGTIEITKTDISNGALIPDCGIEILDENKKVICQGRTDKNGVVRFDSLPYGKYYYREFDAPDGYVLDETPFEFEVKKNGEIIKATMTNKPVEIKLGYITTDTPKNPGTVTTPQTGDDSNTMAAVISIICLVSVAGILFTRKSRKKDNED